MDYLISNAEAKKYAHRIAYEDIRESTKDAFERLCSPMRNNVRLPRNAVATAFWNKLYGFLDEHYNAVFNVHGHRGLERSGQAGQWISMSCAGPYSIQIKSDRGYVDLEINGYAEGFTQFSNDNKALIEKKKLYLREAQKSLAIRKYIDPIDFTQSFETQIPALTYALNSAKELQELIPKLKLKWCCGICEKCTVRYDFYRIGHFIIFV